MKRIKTKSNSGLNDYFIDCTCGVRMRANAAIADTFTDSKSKLFYRWFCSGCGQRFIKKAAKDITLTDDDE